MGHPDNYIPAFHSRRYLAIPNFPFSSRFFFLSAVRHLIKVRGIQEFTYGFFKKVSKCLLKFISFFRACRAVLD